jgi:glucose-1-phosphate thymidylyltransferase
VRGLVLAGGSGKRLRPLTHSVPKQLVPIANRPILLYVIDNLVDANVRDIGVIISPETGNDVRAAVGDGSAWGARVEYIVQSHPAGLAHALLTAREYLVGHDICMVLGDNLLGTRIRETVAAFEAVRELDASIMLKEVQDPSRFAVAELDDKGEIVRLVEKPRIPKSNLALVGVYLFRQSIFEAVARIAPSERGELEITDALTRLIELGGRVRHERIDGWWLDTGTKDDLLLANDKALEDWMVPDVRGSVDAESKVIGRVRIEEGAEIVRSIVHGPAVVGKRAQVIDSRIEPFTSIGDGVRIARSSVARSVIMRDSCVEEISHLENSMIGRRVVVRPAAKHDSGASLLVGDDCKVELSRL